MGMRKQEKAVIIVACVDVLTITIKFFLALLTGSLSLLADAWHSIGDLTTSIMVFLALVMDRKESLKAIDDDKKVRIMRRSSWEPRACALIGVALVAVAAGVFRKVIIGSDLDGVRYPLGASLIVLFLILLSYIRFRFEESVGKETGSPALVADAYHSKVDIYSLSLVLVSLLGELVRLSIDRWIAGVIAVMILTIALRTLYNAFNMMLKSSRETIPDKRSVEDVAVMLTVGYVFSGKNRLVSRFEKRFGLDDPETARNLRRRAFRLAICLVVIIWLSTGVHKVDYNERAVVERFGKPLRMEQSVGPGLHIDWPKPISRIRRVDNQTVRWMRLGYKTVERSEIILWTKPHYLKEFSILTGDGAIVELAANLHYKIKNPSAFLYSAVDPEAKLEMISYEVLCKLAGKMSLFEVLAYNRRNFERELVETIQKKADNADLGFDVIQICFLDIHPSMEVAPAFEEVVSAQEDLETFVQEAKGYKKETVPLAAGEAYTKIQQAESYRRLTVEKASGRAHAFAKMTSAFSRYENVNMFRMRLDALDAWLPGRKLWIIDPNVSDEPLDLFVSRYGVADENPEVMVGGDGRFDY
jgi:HflK protein